MNTVTSWDYIKQNYDSDDRLAVVIKNHMTGQVIQRLDSARAIASPDFQRWLRFHNANGGNIYLSVNASSPRPPAGPGRRSRPSVTFTWTSIRMDRPSLPRS